MASTSSQEAGLGREITDEYPPFVRPGESRFDQVAVRISITKPVKVNERSKSEGKGSQCTLIYEGVNEYILVRRRQLEAVLYDYLLHDPENHHLKRHGTPPFSHIPTARPISPERCQRADNLTEWIYLQKSFYGRWRHFCDVIDPRTLFTSEAKLQQSIELLKQFQNGTLPPGISNKDLWEAQKIKQAIIHPDTGEKIFMPFRMSGFVPFGSPIVLGLLLPNLTLGQTAFWQWLNQSHNACVNYANRNASKPTPVSRFVVGYIGAVSSAVSIAIGLSLVIRRANGLSPAAKLLVQKFVPFPAVATASTCNVVLMRNSELSEGIEVFDKKENVVGTSQIAAKKALTETALTRMVLPAPILIIPPAVMTMLEKTAFLKRNPRWHLPLNGITCTLAFGFALPIAIALFPQVSQIDRSRLEPEIQANTQDSILFYNKGL